MDLRVFLVHTNHCRQAHDLLVQNIAELGIRIAVVSEPYCIPDSPFWHGSKDGRAAIYWSRDRLQHGCSLFRIGDNFVAISCGDIKIVSCYIPPEKGEDRAATFRRALHGLEEVVRAAGPRVILCGDFNARSECWRSQITNWRGRALVNWARNIGLRGKRTHMREIARLLNRGPDLGHRGTNHENHGLESRNGN
ncbi:uncharacterized protein [Linepithema humile]|uniref:uncharacterized protein n=1 Tax=Linepithema humile TaxID=83485 RepID=UPI00351E94AB